MSVFLLLGDTQRSDDGNILGIFLTRDKAERFAKKYFQEITYFSICEYEVSE